MDEKLEKIPGKITAKHPIHLPPKPDSENLKYKLLHAFKHAHPGLDRPVVEMILDHPSELA